jgi:hypothetical protein
MNDVLPPWRGVVWPTLPLVANAVRSARAAHSSCVPDDTVVLTYYSPGHAELRALSFERMRRRPCFMARLVTVCLGSNQSISLGGRDCAPAALFRSVGYMFRSVGYHELIWAKWRFLHEALRPGGGGAACVLFVDSDVVIFRNPFRALSDHQGAATFDLQFQGELACGSSTTCARGLPPETCHLNGGVLLVRSAALVSRVIERGEPDFRPLAAQRRGPLTAVLDQDIAESVIRSSAGNLTACHLPSDAFVGFCMWAWGYNKGNRSLFDRLDPCALVSYHAHCLVSSSDKRLSMERMLSKTRHCVGRGGSSSGGGNGHVLGRWGPRAPPHELGSRPKHLVQRKGQRMASNGRREVP